MAQQTIAKLTVDNQLLTARCEAQAEDYKSLAAELSASNQSLAEVTADKQLVTARYEALLEDNESLTQELAATKQQMQQMEQDGKEEVEQLQQELCQKRKAALRHLGQFQQLEQQRDDLQQQRDDLLQQRDDLQQQRDDLQQQLEHMQQQLEKHGPYTLLGHNTAALAKWAPEHQQDTVDFTWKRLGRGSFGTVYEGRLTPAGGAAGQCQKVALKRLGFDPVTVSLEGAVHQIIQELPERDALLVRVLGMRVMDMPSPAFEALADELTWLRAKKKKLSQASKCVAAVQQRIRQLQEEMKRTRADGGHVAPAFVLVLGYVEGCQTLNQVVAGAQGWPLVSNDVRVQGMSWGDQLYLIAI